MLQTKTIEIVKSTVPLLQEKGVEITTRFYEIMFGENPELLNIFNHTNQKKGRQPQALANAVYAAAMYIDQLEVIVPVVKQIGHKHRSLGVKAEHYPIVGKCLLQAIKEVADAPQEVLDAWAEAYGVIADVFIQVEAEMYKEAEEQAGGWSDFRPFTIVKKETESDVITSFYLQPVDDGELSTFLPGQYVSVQVNIDGEQYTHIRQYSLSDASEKGYYRISVKREKSIATQNGIVSNYLHDHKQEGDTLLLSAPAGDFVLNRESELPVVLISGGVGITPMMSMFNTLAGEKSSRDITFIHAALNSNVHAMKGHVERVAKENDHVRAYTCYSEPTEQDKENKSYDKEGFIDLEWLQSVVPSIEAEFYFCGPVSFMKHVKAMLKEMGVTDERIHFEFFGPAASLD
ncbi:NO-inducible flavohemoprotein [Priestia taiwanensis]|uniref:Flavohemoprotein n=1 Tax=Priestia taiwanensis TaxID=1347902 RepID=A0A917APC6_9BACI|nr:NO-inducible flavohemoprotein [Priestia taiwanensis]MBM7362691.1 nitric oxide dioxygenase [Priestia taiwanensis]GGE64277.1 flavohemoprotein [Priestia taiwanensis]